MNFMKNLLEFILATWIVSAVGVLSNSLAPARRLDEQEARAIHEILPMNPYTRAQHEAILDLRHQMLTRSIKFDDHFRNLLKKSKLDLHGMFTDTYGLMYQHNTEIFTSMFESLEQYYAHGEVKLTKSMESFFERLYQKIFQVYNTNRVFTPEYLECATKQLKHLKPFKDIPDKLIREIRHVLVAARAFVQAMNQGIDVIKNIMMLKQPAQCVSLINDKLLKNTLVAGASGQVASKVPCLSFCEQVITRCIGRGNQDVLSERWRGYIIALSDLARKLSTSYNIETIIAPMDVQISEAIMNFQETAGNITQSVLSVCGRVTSSPVDSYLGHADHNSNNHRLVRRAPSPAPLLAASIARSSNSNRQVGQQFAPINIHQPLASLTLGGQLRLKATTRNGFNHGPLVSHEDLSPIGQKSPLLIEEIRAYLLSTKAFWSLLPNTVCTSNMTIGSNAGKKQTNCFHEPFGLSDINSDVRYRVELHQQIERLVEMRTKIEIALEGKEVELQSGPTQSAPQVYQNILPSHNGRIPFVPTTSTTTTTSEPPSDSQDEDEPIEHGSGEEELDCNPDMANCDSDPSEDPDFESTETTDTEADLDEDPTGPDHSTTTQMPINGDRNDIEIPVGPQIEEDKNSLVTVLDSPGARKSGQTSSKLVIESWYRLMFPLLMFVAPFILNNLNQNQLTLAQGRYAVNRH